MAIVCYRPITYAGAVLNKVYKGRIRHDLKIQINHNTRTFFDFFKAITCICLVLALLGLWTDWPLLTEMADFSNLLHTSTSEIPTFFIYLKSQKDPPYGPLKEAPPWNVLQSTNELPEYYKSALSLNIKFNPFSLTIRSCWKIYVAKHSVFVVRTGVFTAKGFV